MSIGSFLATTENLELVKKNSWKFGRPKIIEMGVRYYEQHLDQVGHIYLAISVDIENIEQGSRGERHEQRLA